MNTEHDVCHGEAEARGARGGRARRPHHQQGPHPLLLNHSDVGFSSLSVQEKRDLTEPFVPLPGHSNVLGTRNPS